MGLPHVTGPYAFISLHNFYKQNSYLRIVFAFTPKKCGYAGRNKHRIGLGYLLKDRLGDIADSGTYTAHIALRPKIRNAVMQISP